MEKFSDSCGCAECRARRRMINVLRMEAEVGPKKAMDVFNIVYGLSERFLMLDNKERSENEDKELREIRSMFKEMAKKHGYLGITDEITEHNSKFDDPAYRPWDDLPEDMKETVKDYLIERKKILSTPTLDPSGVASSKKEETTMAMATAQNTKKRMQLSAEEKAAEAAEKRGDAKIVRRGNEIIIPEDMDLAEARLWLKRKEEDEETYISIIERVDVYPFDGALAFSKALTRRFGFTSMVPPQSFFDQPPTFIGVEVGVGKTEQVPWGKMAIPGIEGTLETGITKKTNGQFVFQITGDVKKKDTWIVKQIADETRKIAREESIYKGQAIRMHFDDPNPLQRFNPNDTPKFFDLTKADKQAEELTYSEETARVVQSALWTPIEKTAVARKNRINLKRGILLAGKPGVGKTLTAIVTADKSVKNGWTFIYLDTVKHLQSAIYFAQQYAPAVIFAEDIDRVTNERDDAMNEILNVVDGIDTKTGETMIVLTTNHLEQIKPVMLRPGRIDTVIDLQPPDAKAAERLVRVYARDENGNSLIKPGEELTSVGERLAGQIPAVIAEVVAKSKLTALEHLEIDDEMQLTKKDLETAAIAMVEHIKLLDRPEEVYGSDMEVLGNQIGYHLGRAVDRVRYDYGPEFIQRVAKQLTLLSSADSGKSMIPPSFSEAEEITTRV